MKDDQKNRLIYALRIISGLQDVEMHEDQWQALTGNMIPVIRSTDNYAKLIDSLVNLTSKDYEFDLIEGRFRVNNYGESWKELNKSAIKEIAIGVIADAIVKK